LHIISNSFAAITFVSLNKLNQTLAQRRHRAMEIHPYCSFGGLHDLGDICDRQPFMVSQDESGALFVWHGIQRLVDAPLGLAGNRFLIGTRRMIRQLLALPLI
jgi:hypothetical protein